MRLHLVKQCACGRPVWGQGDDTCVGCGGRNCTYHCPHCADLHYAGTPHTCGEDNSLIDRALDLLRGRAQ